MYSMTLIYWHSNSKESLTLSSILIPARVGFENKKKEISLKKKGRISDELAAEMVTLIKERVQTLFHPLMKKIGSRVTTVSLPCRSPSNPHHLKGFDFRVRIPS